MLSIDAEQKHFGMTSVEGCKARDSWNFKLIHYQDEFDDRLHSYASNYFFVIAAVQFSTTMIGFKLVPSTEVLTRNRFPSFETAYLFGA